MVIKASPSREIAQLVATLAGDDDVQRDAAAARLTVIGARGIDRLLAAYETADDHRTKIAILRVLEAIGDHRAVDVARRALTAGGDVAVAAAAALGGLLNSPDRRTATNALDLLVASVLDAAAGRLVRLAAYNALQSMPDEILGPLKASLKADPDRTFASLLLTAPSPDGIQNSAVWQEALDGRLPDKPAALRRCVAECGRTTPPGAMRTLVEAVRVRESAAQSASTGNEWRATRGALHQALALRGSRVALYDLRESLMDARAPLPAAFLAALHVIGDASCLEPLAKVYSHAGGEEERWRHQLAEAFRAIVRRERITRRHSALKRITARWPDASRAFETRSGL